MRLTRPSLVHRRIGSSEKQGPVIAIHFQIKADFNACVGIKEVFNTRP
jgi:hypothetical protein